MCHTGAMSDAAPPEPAPSATILLVRDGSAVVPLDVDVHRIPARHSADGKLREPEHEHHDLRFLFVADPGQRLKISCESNDLRWFSRAEVGQVTDEPSVLRMLDKAGPFG